MKNETYNIEEVENTFNVETLENELCLDNHENIPTGEDLDKAILDVQQEQV